MKRSQSHSDQFIVDGIRNNAAWALESLYKLDRNRIINFVINNSGDYDDAQETLQEGVLAVYKNILNGRYKVSEKAQLKTYLNKVCRFWWYKELRKRKPLISIQEFDEKRKRRELETKWKEIEKDFENEENKNKMIEAIEKYFNLLGEKCKTVLRMRFWDGIKMEEIARQLGNSLQVVKNRSSDCIGKLYDMYHNKSDNA